MKRLSRTGHVAEGPAARALKVFAIEDDPVLRDLIPQALRDINALSTHSFEAYDRSL